MGTPIPRLRTELAVKGCTSEPVVRPMTEEEKQMYANTKPYKRPRYVGNLEDYHDNKRLESEEMGKSKKPDLQTLKEWCVGYPNRWKAAKAIAEKHGFHPSTVVGWINDNPEIKFDKEVEVPLNPDAAPAPPTQEVQKEAAHEILEPATEDTKNTASGSTAAKSSSKAEQQANLRHVPERFRLANIALEVRREHKDYVLIAQDQEVSFGYALMDALINMFTEVRDMIKAETAGEHHE